MIALGWNCRGLGNLRTVRVLGKLVQRWNPKIIFLSETKVKKNAMEKIMEKINFVNGLIVPRKGRGGGLAMLWKREVALEIMDILEITLMRSFQNRTRNLNGT